MGCACTKPIVREDRLPSPKPNRHSVRFTEGLHVAQSLNNSISTITELDIERRKKDHLRHHSQQIQLEQQHQQEQQSLEQKQQQQQHQHQENQARVRERSNGFSGPHIKPVDHQYHSKRTERKDVLKDPKYVETPRPRNLPRHHEGEQVAAGWPAWLTDEAREAVDGWVPRRADSFEKLDKIGQGTYSNVYKARDLDSKKIVALKKVRFDNLDRDSVRFMAREIVILRNLDHPNVIKLEGLVTSRMSCSLYLVFEYMEHDLAGLIASPEVSFTEPQVKCYLHQLLSGLEHCHSKHVLHRDIKGSNLLLDNNGILKIADFGLATFFNPEKRQPLTSRVVTLWYRPPELLLGATEYDIGVDLWSTGCILAELLARKPIMPGRTEVEQLHKIFKLCGSPSEDFWKKSKLPHATIFKPQQPYKTCIAETFKDFPRSAILLLEKLLAIEPADRGTASNALKSEFFNTKPYACDPSSLPRYPPSKEMDAKLREEERRRQWRAAEKTSRVDTQKRPPHRSRAIPAPEANAELSANIQRRRVTNAYHTHQNPNVKSRSEKFPPPHEDGAVGYVMRPARPTRLAPGNLSHAFAELSRNAAELSRNAAPSALSSRSATMETNAWRKQPVIIDDVRMAPRRPSNRSSKSISVSQSQDLSQIMLAEREALARGSHRERPTYRQRERESFSKTTRESLSKPNRHTSRVQTRKSAPLESSEFSGSFRRSSTSFKDEKPLPREN